MRSAAICALAAVLATVSGCTSNRPATVPSTTVASVLIAAPEEYRSPHWDAALDGDNPTVNADQTAAFTTLNDPAATDLAPDNAATLRQLAIDVTTSELTGVALDRWGAYVPPGFGVRAGKLLDTADVCHDVQMIAVSPQKLPTPKAVNGTIVATDTDTYAKTLVAWSATCPQTPLQGNVSVTYVYAVHDTTGWTPVRSTVIPRQHDGSAAAGVVPEWALNELDGCTRTDIRARLELAYAWVTLCSDATAAGIPLEATDGWRDAANQAQRYADAVEYYGGTTAADKYVAYADALTCASSHCAGEAIDIAPDHQVLAWLNATVGCLTGDGMTDPPAGDCPSGATPVPRIARYGFTIPLASSSGHLEWALPLDELNPADATLSCAPPASRSVATVIDQVWRCKLAGAGIIGADANRVIAEALVVSRCASGWNPSAIAFGGRYLTADHPATGAPYDGTGVFQIPPSSFTAFGPPGGRITNAADNAAAAAAIYLRERTLGRWGWGPFPCAAANDGVFTVSVLPERGGPALPAWATEFAAN